MHTQGSICVLLIGTKYLFTAVCTTNNNGTQPLQYLVYHKHLNIYFKQQRQQQPQKE